MNNIKLIFTFFRQPAYGLSLEAFLVTLLENKTFSYQYQRLVYDRMDDYDYPYTDAERKVLRKINELSPKSIESQFNKKQLRSPVFLEKLSKDPDQMKLLSTYFDRRLAACLELLKGETVYWKERASDHPGMLPLFVANESARVTYFFTRRDDGIDYQLKVKFQDKIIQLKDGSAEILANNPCWLLHKGTIYHFDDTTEGAKISPFLKSEQLHIPDKLADKFLESFMLKASRRFHVEYSGFDVSTEPNKREAIISIEQDLNHQAVLQLNFRYDRFLVNAAQEQSLLVAIQRSEPGMKLLRFNRDAEFERGHMNALSQLGLKQIRPSWFTPDIEDKSAFHHEELIDWLARNKQALTESGFIFETSWQGQSFEAVVPRLVQVVVNENADWFDVRAKVEINGILIPFIRFRKNIIEKNRYFKLPDGKTVLLPESWFADYADLFAFGEEDSEDLRIHKQHQGLLHEHPIFQGSLSPRLSENQKSVYLNQPKGDFSLPEGLNAQLRDYQHSGFQWLSGLAQEKLGACLADDMGLGKTLQVIALLLKTAKYGWPDSKAADTITQAPQLDLFGFSKRKAGPSLVVMAPSLIYNWENELHRFAPDLHVRKHLGQRRRTDADFFIQADVVLTTYGIVRNDIALLKDIPFEHIVLDESQLIKNARSISFQAVKQLRGRQRIVLTGTPVENSLTDLWSQLTFLQPGLLGSQKYFKQEFVIPIEQQQDQSRLEKLRKIIQPFILRRTKEEVAPELPELTRRVHYCEMSDEHRDMYEKQKSIYRNKILESVSRDGMERSQMLILRGLSHLRQLAIHPGLLDSEYTGDSAKIDQVIHTISRIQEAGKKVLLFSPFVRHLQIYKNYFQAQKIPFAYLTGEIPQSKRAEIVSGFERKSGFNAFLIQLKTGGAGLNLTEADHVLLLDPWWNPAAEEQAIARSHRMGQKLPVFAWRFITKDTIEEKILKLQERKGRIASDILETSGTLGGISQDELNELFD